MRTLALVVFIASAAFGQNVSRTFQLTHTGGVGLQEIATTLRTVFDVKTVSVDPAVSTLTLSGTADQIAVTEWLIPQLDVLPGTNILTQKYLYAGNNNDIVEVWGMKNAPSPVDLQEVITDLRTVTDIQKIYMSSAPRILVMRSDANHMAMADFLFPSLDQPPATRTSQAIESFLVPGGGGDIVVSYGLAHTNGNTGQQAILTNLRTVLQIQKIYQRTAPRVLIMRANAAQIQMAKWLIPMLDTEKPSGAGAEMRAPNGNDDVLHVFYLAKIDNMSDLIASLKEIRLRAFYPTTTPPAITVRGTADQVAMVAKMLPLN